MNWRAFGTGAGIGVVSATTFLLLTTQLFRRVPGANLANFGPAIFGFGLLVAEMTLAAISLLVAILWAAKESMDNLTKDRESAQRVAQEVLDGQIGVIHAARTLLPLLWRSPELTSEEDFNLIRVIGRETDDLPLGHVREQWDAVVLAYKDREIARCESLWRDQFRAACERIIERLHNVP